MKKSKLAFIIIKIRINGQDYLVLRRDTRWRDVNFVGGHAEDSDRGSSLNTALRELREEIPLFEDWCFFELEPLLENASYGPVFSKSAEVVKEYSIDFYRLRFTNRPIQLLQFLLEDVDTVLVEVGFLCSERRLELSSFFSVLSPDCNRLSALECSWTEDLSNHFPSWSAVLQHRLP